MENSNDQVIVQTDDINEDLIKKLVDVLDLHNKMRKSYFFTPPLHASQRRKYEVSNSLYTVFRWKGDEYEINQETSCSCRYVYYHVSYKKNGCEIKADIRFVKRILAQIK